MEEAKEFNAGALCRSEYRHQELALELKGIYKSFSGVNVLKKMQLRLYKGKGTAIVGENGAGKSTLMKIMTGIYTKDSGVICLKDKPKTFANVIQSKKDGIAIIHQEILMAEQLSIVQNMFLGNEYRTFLGTLDTQRMANEAKRYLAKLDFFIDVNTPVETLNTGQKQLVEIAKALLSNPKIIIFDEPTSSLTDKETQRLYDVVKELKKANVSVAWITHRMEEIPNVAEYVTVIRDGEFIAEYKTENVTNDEIVNAMIGRELTERYNAKTPVKKQPASFEIQYLHNEYLRNINLKIQRGEITTIYGLVGAGRTELGLSIIGEIKNESGKILYNGELYQPKDSKHAIKNGIYYLSEDRKLLGLHLDKGIDFNITLASLNRYALLKGFPLVNDLKVKSKSKEYINDLKIRTFSETTFSGNLSGGNQQKVSFAKGLSTEPDLIILDEPTRGVDVGARKEIYDIIAELKRQNKIVLIFDSYLEEVIGISDRVITMQGGTITGDLYGDEINQETIVSHALGLKKLQKKATNKEVN